MRLAEQMLRAAAGAHPARPAPPLAGVVAWFAADHISGHSDGDAITTWKDLSGNGNDATGTGTYKTAILNSLPIMRFNGTTQAFSTAALTWTNNWTVFVVAKSAATPTGNAGPLNADGSVGNNRIFQLRMTGATTINTLAFISGGGAQTSVTATATTTNFNIFSVRRTTTTAEMIVGGVSTSGASASAAAGSSILTIGCASGTASQRLAGDIAEVLIYPSTLGTTDFNTVESYLHTKWGV